MNIGLTLRNARKNKGITIDRMAQLMNVSQPTITRWENGTIDTTSSILTRYLQVLEISLAEFFGGDTVTLPTELADLLSEARELSPDKVRILTEFIKKIKE